MYIFKSIVIFVFHHIVLSSKKYVYYEQSNSELGAVLNNFVLVLYHPVHSILVTYYI